MVKPNRISGFESFPDYCTCCIYSPFSEKNQVEELLLNVEGKDDSYIREYVSNNIKTYISPYLFEIVKKYNIVDDVTDEQIKEGYISLICDFIRIKMES